MMYNLLKKVNTSISNVFKEDYMRRDSRNYKKSVSDKIIMYSIIGGSVLTLILIGLVVYSKNLSDDIQKSTINLGEIANAVNDTESASTEMGKTVEEKKNEIDSINENESESNTTNKTKNENASDTKYAINTSNIENTNNKQTSKVNENSQSKTKNNVETEKNEEEKESLNFSMPVEGEILKEYAKDNLVYSETLKEWVTHNGIDIKADKTTVVKASEKGTVKSIKNDPRYGLTVVIDHGDGFESLYANLLTSEFVVEGEVVEKGQSIGTVGNTAVFEIADEPHLHFEILKDSISQDPNIYLK